MASLTPGPLPAVCANTRERCRWDAGGVTRRRNARLPADGRGFSASRDVCDAGMTRGKESECLAVARASRGCRDASIGSRLPWEGSSAAVAMTTHRVADGPEVFFHLIVEVDAELLSRMLGDGGK